ncbi:hypothetical protein JTE90_005060 [Oedothorax gibbosus]|uniref:15-hydroxyprostaglandin dehydrogenase [NAD(+)] n=1 Tax=Oedothorax gibbosus TaxID=931172 RepID=A0AAV6VCN9_9ARAC|nr:hypothetical protein JTE90_005060 [Oedothorax gibbosus]
MAFNNKVAIVTGGAQGIGNAYVSALLKARVKVCICDINVDLVNEYIEKLPDDQKDFVIFQKCDVSSFSDFKEAFKKVVSHFGKIDIVVNNAGIVNESDWKKMVGINFIGVIHGIKLGFEFMDTKKGGHGGIIINTGSCTGFDAYELVPVYTACKHGVHGLTKSYGTEFHFNRTGVKVCAVCPGAVETQLHHSLPSLCIDEEAAKNDRHIWKAITPDDVAKALIKIIQDDQNGALLRIDEEAMRYA